MIRCQIENDSKTSKSTPGFALPWPLWDPEGDNNIVQKRGRFTFYKLPKRQDKESRETGVEYLYLDSATRSWRRSKQLMNTTKSVLGRTLQQLYEAHASEVCYS
ncbi:hypothetical protein J1605_019321 [Eschrichtius robustus]|uniref:Deoxyribonuclease-2-beta n=1 Tax=Eschrichtius robustus TaxID=9764 RepID=A0AB34HKT8_ESCRO|nr:hypothetical protein J1605_019321 [Eschrichtius robustus]